DGCVAMVDNPDITIDELITFIKAPDFPTGGTILGYNGVKEAFHTGRGKIVLRGKANIETNDKTGKETIIINEIPYQVNKANLVSKIAELVNTDKISGISDLRDESDRNGLRIVVEVKRDAMASVVLSKLYKYSYLQTSYGVNNIALVNGRPQQLNVKQMLTEFIKFRLEVIVRRTKYDLKKAEERAHILEGLLIALANIDQVIAIIRASKTVEAAKEGLIAAFELSDIQAKAILEMRLQKLVSLEVDKIKKEHAELMLKIANYKEIIASEYLQRGIIKDEMAELKEKYGDERRTDITYAEDEIKIEDLIANEEMVVTISSLGYIKRTKTSEYRQQSRGGKGSKGSKTRDKDFVEHMFVVNNHDYLLLFTEMGRCFWIRGYEIPEGSKTGTGRVMQNLIRMPKEDKVKAYIRIEDLTDEEYINNNYIIFCTRKGVIKKTLVEQFSRIRTNGINAITINEGDMLMEVKLTNGENEIVIANRNGRAIRFPEAKVRSMGRSAAGVRGIKLDDENDFAVGMLSVKEDSEKTIFVVSENGYGKRSEIGEYRTTNRG
ncbi:MAG TPA: DNA gyrase subunit A, partial [Saprospirales bacterium]|nr:DNA gyrase subunit A [Saprospirales bacterium]